MLTYQLPPAAHGGWVRGARLHTGYQFIYSLSEILSVNSARNFVWYKNSKNKTCPLSSRCSRLWRRQTHQLHCYSVWGGHGLLLKGGDAGGRAVTAAAVLVQHEIEPPFVQT